MPRPCATPPMSWQRLQFRQEAFQFVSAWLQKRRQLEALAQIRKRLVDGEAGFKGRDLEQHPARLPEVNRSEILAIFLPRGMEMVFCDELARHVGLLAVVPGTEGDVVHRAAAHACARKADCLA